jgi:ATP-dependent Clp protease ATP-binding subunit ClpA
MFERFTGRARQAIVLAQEESRRLNHSYIGTEHLLLGLLSEPQGVARLALDAVGVTLEDVRQRVEAVVKKGKKAPSGHIPFTPRAKKVLELGLREALRLGHDYIGTEHLLLGLIREGEGLGTKILVQAGVELEALRRRVLDSVPPPDQGDSRRRRFWPRSRLGVPAVAGGDEIRTTTATDASLDEAHRLAGDTAVGSHHLLLATLSDPSSAAAKALGTLGIDLERARSALREVDVVGTTDELPEEAGRRRLAMRLTGDTLLLETTDPELVGRGRAAIAAVGESGDVIHGAQAEASPLGAVWQAWRDCLQTMTGPPDRPTEPPPD